MKIKVQMVKVFGICKDYGNLAAIIIEEEDISRKAKQNIARIIGVSETVFIKLEENTAITMEYYTPNREIGLCGHGTIGGLIALEEIGVRNDKNYIVNTKTGNIEMFKENQIYFMKQKNPEVFPGPKMEEIIRALNTKKIDKNLPIEIVSTGVKDIIVPIDSKESLKNIKINSTYMEMLSEKYDVVGVHVFSKNNHEIYCRNFAPFYGIEEECATGTSNGALSAYLNRYYKEKSFEFKQGFFMNNPCLIYGKVVNKQIYIGGKGAIAEEKTLSY